ncbi:MAG: nicotinamide-nucleotide adenylyltransferase [Thermofilum sp. ex4484_15]|nr:MAG: nicotinamide-nucleotide adenylyltransferase [Thermofilum sp. ex4484_15]
MAGRGLYIGRFQPFHLGHLHALKWILDREEEVIIAIGSAQYSHSPYNPFTLGERVEMIWRVLKDEELTDRCIIVGVPDTNGIHSLWTSLLKSFLPTFTRAYTNDPLSALLLRESGVEVKGIPFFKREIYEATRIRRLIAEGGAWEELVHPRVAEYIKEIGGVERLRKLFKLS